MREFIVFPHCDAFLKNTLKCDQVQKRPWIQHFLQYVWKYLTHFWQKFVKLTVLFKKLLSTYLIDFTNLFFSESTVWKSTPKRYHSKKISVKSHNKNLWKSTLQMHDFLVLRGISGLFTLNEFWRIGFILDFIEKNIFLDYWTLLDIFATEN